MKLLYLDTTTEWICIGIYNISEDLVNRIYFYKEKRPRESSYSLVSEIARGFSDLGMEKVDRIVCVSGPGSFTGIRIAVSTARNLSQLWDVPCLGLNTLEVYASHYFGKTGTDSSVILDARMKKVYAGRFGKDGFSGSFDIEPNRVGEAFPLENSLVYSDILFPNSSSMDLDYPEPDYIIKVKLNEIIKLNTNEHGFASLEPYYMRGTYAEGKEHGQIRT